MKVNCAAMPAGLLETKLFGRAPGRCCNVSKQVWQMKFDAIGRKD
jgi:transcriptional regulator with GAF, ATPase, and Fis domain